jgi:tetratricopeptide (TPR) repeat protein
MRLKLKSIIIPAGILGVCAVILLAVKISTDNRYKKQIPEAPDPQGMTAPVRSQVSGAIGETMHNPSSGNLGRLGMTFHSSSFYDKAATCYKLAIQRNHKRWVWNYYLGYLDKEMGDNAGVVSNFSEVVRKTPANYMAWFYIAEGYQALGQNDKASDVYRKIISEAGEIPASGNQLRKDFFPLRTYARFQMATIMLNSGRLNSADSTLKILLKDQPSFGQAYRLLGSICSRNGDQAGSKKYLERAGDLMIYTPPVDTIIDILARNSRSEVYLLKQIDDAEKGGYSHFAAELVSNALKDIPDNKYVISKALKIFLVMNLNRLALPLVDRHLEYFSSDVSELKMVADLCMKKGLNKEAVKYYLQVSKLQPEDASVHMSVALCLGKDNAVKQAIDSVNLLIRRYPDNMKVLTDGAFVMLMLGEKSQAESVLSGLSRRFPADPKVKQLSGILLQQKGKEDEALKLFEDSFKSDPKDLSTARYLTEILLKQKRWGEAISCFRTALGYNPNDPNLQESLGSLLILCPDVNLRNLTDGREYSERAFINKSGSPSTMVSAGISLAQANAEFGDKESAVKVMRITLDQARSQNAPQELLSDLQKRLESYSR